MWLHEGTVGPWQRYVHSTESVADIYTYIYIHTQYNALKYNSAAIANICKILIVFIFEICFSFLLTVSEMCQLHYRFIIEVVNQGGVAVD